MVPWDQKAARVLARQLAKGPVTPNQVTAATLLIAVAGALLLTTGQPRLVDLGAGLFVLSRFLDHMDGELARQKQMTSKLGYYLDYLSGAISYGALFSCLGVAFKYGWLGHWSLLLGFAGASAAVIAMFANLGIDKASDQIDDAAGDAVGYPGFAGFELEDGIYLLAPITWLGLLEPFFIAAGVGAAVYCLWSVWRLAHMRQTA